MKKLLVILVLGVSVTACNDSGTSINIETDSLKQKLDTLGDKIGEKADEVWDSTKSKANDLKQEIEARFDSVQITKKDSAR